MTVASRTFETLLSNTQRNLDNFERLLNKHDRQSMKKVLMSIMRYPTEQDFELDDNQQAAFDLGIAIKQDEFAMAFITVQQQAELNQQSENEEKENE